MVVEFNFSQMLEYKLTFEDYFLLFCVKHSQRDLIISYVNKVKSYENEVFIRLSDDGFIKYSQDNDGKILFRTIELTEKAKSLFPETKDFEVCFAELKQTYPKSFGERKLHLDNQRCKELYKKTITKNGAIDIELHNRILKCIEAEVHSRTRTGKMQFIQALPTYLHQKNWEAYLEEIDNNTNFDDEKVDLI